MSQLLSSSSSMAVNSNPRFLSSSSVFVSGGFAVKRHGFTLKPTTTTVKLSVKSRQADYFEKQRFGDVSSSTPSFSQNVEGLPARVYVGHSLYKGKAALTVEPRAPKFVALDSGAFKLSKDGFLLLQFAPSAGVQQYDWSKKQVFSMSVTEIGSLVSLGPKESCEFFHDPFKGKSDEGKVRKVLKVEPLPDGSGHFFNLSS